MARRLRLVAAIAVLFAAVTAAPVPAQGGDGAESVGVPEPVGVGAEAPEAADLEPRIQDEVQSLKSLDGDLITLHGRVVELWAIEEHRPGIRQLVLDAESSPTLITAIGRLLANRKVRESVPHFLSVLGSGRLEEQQRSDLFTYVLMPYHETESVLSELDAAVTAAGLDDAERSRLFDVYVDVVERVKEKKRDATDRYDAVSRLLSVSEQVDPKGRVAILATLARLCGGVVRFPDIDGWRAWFDELTGKRTDRSLSMPDIYRHLWDQSRAEADRLRVERRTLAREIITRMRQALEPPVAYLTDSDPDVRKTALLAIQAMSKELPAETRQPAVGALIQLLGSGRAAGILGDLFTAAGALGRNAADADRRALVTALFEEGVPAEPEQAIALLRAVGEIGLVDRPGRLAEVYGAAAKEAEDWARVRADAVKVAHTDPDGLDLVMAGLSDADAAVREAAAVVLLRLKDRLGDRATECLDVLAVKAGGEQSAGARRRMLESTLALAGDDVGLLTDKGLRGVVQAFAFEGVDGRRVALNIVAAALKRPALAPTVRGELESLIASALNGQSSTELRKATVEALVKTPSASAMNVLEAWFVQPKSRNGAWKGAKDALLAARIDDASGCWSIAEALAAWPVETPWEAAVEFGARAEAIVAATAEHPLTAKLPEMREALAGWRMRSDDPAALDLALAYMDARLTATPNDARLRLARSDLLARLAVRDASRGDELRGRAIADLEFLLGPDSHGLRNEQRPEVLRRLARRRLDLRKAKDCLAALASLRDLGTELDEADLYLRARAYVSDRDTDRSPALADLARISSERAAELGDALHLARAAAILLDPDSAGHEEAAAHLNRVTEKDTPLAEALEELLERSRRTRVAFARVLDGEGVDEDRALLKSDVDLCLLHAIASLPPDVDTERGRVVMAVLTDIVGADVLAGISWPEDANGQAASTVTTELRKRWRARPSPQKIVALFLNGT